MSTQKPYAVNLRYIVFYSPNQSSRTEETLMASSLMMKLVMNLEKTPHVSI